MPKCKMCGSDFKKNTNRKYCSDNCVEAKAKEQLENLKISKRIKAKEMRESWTCEIIELDKINHNRLIPINQLLISESKKKYLKKLISDEKLTTYKNIKMRRVDGVSKTFKVVAVTPKMIKKIFETKYKLYKSNFRTDCLKVVKYLKEIYNLVNVSVSNTK